MLEASIYKQPRAFFSVNSASKFSKKSDRLALAKPMSDRKS